MKQFLIKLSSFFLIGCAFTAGTFFFVWAKEYVSEYGEVWYVIHSDENPKYMKILSHQKNDFYPYFTISGKIKNESKAAYSEIGIDAIITIDGVMINKCSTSINHIITPDRIVDFEISCKDMAGAGLPSGIDYLLMVSYAGYETEKKK